MYHRGELDFLYRKESCGQKGNWLPLGVEPYFSQDFEGYSPGSNGHIKRKKQVKKTQREDNEVNKNSKKRIDLLKYKVFLLERRQRPMILQAFQR